MGPPKQRGRPTKVTQDSGFTLARKRRQQRKHRPADDVEFDEAGFAAFMFTHPVPSDHVSPVQTHQAEPQHPEPAEDPFEYDKAVKNEDVNYPADPDSDAGTDEEDLEFCVVGAEGQLLTDAASRHHQRERQKFVDFEAHKASLLAEYAKLVTGNLTGCICSVEGCKSASEYQCYTCRSGGALKSTYCKVHARMHWKEYICHKILDASDEPLQSNSRRLDCCEMSPVQSGRIVQLSTQECSEHVICHTCSNHSISSLLMQLGFMVSKFAKPDHAFAVPMVHTALKARIHGTSYESCAGIFFSDSSKSARSKGLYQPFMDAIRFFSGLTHAIQHGTIHATDTVGWGKTVCPMCEGNGDNEYPLVLKQMDGFESARKRAVEFGGGHNHGHYSWARQFWFDPGEDYVAKASKNAKGPAADSLGCSSRHHSGEEERIARKNRNQQSQYDRIVHQGCMHDFFERIFNAKGERLLYCDTVIKMIRKQYPNCELVLSYDVICKEVAHLQQPYMRQSQIEMPYIAVLPSMHAQAHSKECQIKFSPRILAGLGTKLDGEGVERENARLAKSIGLMVGETEGNRELDISLIVEDYNSGKVQSALKIIRHKLDLAYADLAFIESIIGEPTDLSRGSYSTFINENNAWRTNLLKDRHNRKVGITSVEEQMYLLREQADERGRTIRRTQRILQSHVGTNVASKLHRHLQSQYTQLKGLLEELNDLSEETSAVTALQVINELELKGTSEESQIQKYWRGVEDIYHWHHALRNFIKFYEKRVDNQNGQWVRELEAVDACDSPLLCKVAFKVILTRKLKEELGFLERGQDLARHYATSRRPEQHLHIPTLQGVLSEGVVNPSHSLRLRAKLLEKDIRFLMQGADESVVQDALTTHGPAVTAYSDQIRRLGETSPTLLIAHADLWSDFLSVLLCVCRQLVLPKSSHFASSSQFPMAFETGQKIIRFLSHAVLLTVDLVLSQICLSMLIGVARLHLLEDVNRSSHLLVACCSF
ncbi:hypothetical protein CcCBS67573_g10007 [Chytriomyces confervae]|uniref:CxC2-like cysteine cluster KDZ transposase-associated domain-containing protein n=1 Tax=Chytriomyces confervae TaxID=246404 RepID=A0A507DJ25_9FUNG|nr:hypothetical protein CcCBS67573_g10007 [Chytriomyces confervae]